VEMDPWVVSEVLDPNLAVTGFQDQTVVHISPVETLLEQAAEHGGMLIIPDSLTVHVACISVTGS
jgi:hypothetical protein